MPRMLTIWLETGDQPLLLELIKTKKKKCVLSSATEVGIAFRRIGR